MALSSKERAKLGRAVEGRNSDQGFIYANKADFAALVASGFVEFNDANSGDNGTFGVRATDAGMTEFDPARNPAGSTAPVRAGSSFKIAKGIVIPPAKRRVGEGPNAGSRYPFDVLEIGDSFHVAPSAKLPKPAKSIASSVTAANMKYSTKVPGQHRTRKGTMVDNYQFSKLFQIREVGTEDPEGPGARIWRTDTVTKDWTPKQA